MNISEVQKKIIVSGVLVLVLALSSVSLFHNYQKHKFPSLAAVEIQLVNEAIAETNGYDVRSATMEASFYNVSTSAEVKRSTSYTWTSCEDSDGGVQPYKYGVVKAVMSKEGVIENKVYTIKDRNRGQNRIIEIYCRDGKPRMKIIACENGNQEGACVTDEDEEMHSAAAEELAPSELKTSVSAEIQRN